jgi:hypothetical protein
MVRRFSYRLASLFLGLALVCAPSALGAEGADADQRGLSVKAVWQWAASLWNAIPAWESSSRQLARPDRGGAASAAKRPASQPGGRTVGLEEGLAQKEGCASNPDGAPCKQLRATTPRDEIVPRSGALQE